MADFEPGLNKCEIVSGKSGKSANGTPYVEVSIVPLEYQSNGEWVDAHQIPQRVFWYLTDAAWDYTSDKLRQLGFDGNFEDPGFAINECAFRCKLEEWQGETRARWDLPAGSALKQNEIAELQKRWKASSSSPTTPSFTETPSPSTTIKPQNMTEAWRVWMEKNGGDSAQFQSAIDAVARVTNKKPEAFGPDEWQKVIDGTPF